MVIVKYVHRDMADGEYWLDLVVDGELFESVGPFTSEAARDKASEDISTMCRSFGAADIPSRYQ